METTIEEFSARPPIHIKEKFLDRPTGLTPSQVKRIYHLPKNGGKGTIAIVDAFDYPSAREDLNIFSKQFKLPTCNQNNNCFERVQIEAGTRPDDGWSQEAALDTQWAHAIAPQAKILLVEAKSDKGSDLLQAVDYARNLPDVVAISLSWGGTEFASMNSLDYHFLSPSGKATFFASAGDSGHDVEWPAVSPNVVAIGGTSLQLLANTVLVRETAWKGSGGGISKFVSQPDFQKNFGITNSNKFRSVPDVAFNADPNSGFSVYFGGSTKGWMKVGGTSAGAPQWAAIQALGQSANNKNFYRDGAAKTHKKFFRDITSGFNGFCLIFCKSRASYDFVTGLGSPQTVKF